MVDIAETMVINYEAKTLTINGEPFPYIMAERGPLADALHVPSGEVFVVSVPILVGRLEFDDAVEPPRPWCQCDPPCGEG